MEKLTKKDIKGIAGSLERATQNLMEICSMMLRKERNGEPDLAQGKPLKRQITEEVLCR